MTKTLCKAQCVRCKTNTNHTVHSEHLESGNPNEYHYTLKHQIIICNGCDTLSFRKIYTDYENAWPTGEDEWEIPSTTENFPKLSEANIDDIHLPDIVGNIYKETCNAYSQGSLTLAGIGFRTTLEAICNDQKIPGNQLSTRINNLASKGLISKKDSNRLHSIRFMGNDAAHDIKKPQKKHLEAALIIVEHLLTTVYVLDSETKHLDGIIEDYDTFEKLLIEKLKTLKPGDSYPIQKILGKEIRKINGSTRNFENKLNERISKKEFPLLSIAGKAHFLGSREELQHYTLTTEKNHIK